MKRLFFLLTLLFYLALSAQQPGTWSTHLAYYDGRQAVRAGQMLYALMGENLLSYDTQTKLVTPMDRVSHGLSEKSIAHIAYGAAHKVLVVLYASGNVDLYYPESERIVNLPQLRLSSEDFMLSQLTVSGDVALVSTSQGLLWIDLPRQEIKGYYKIGACQDATLFDGHVYAAMTDGHIKYASTRANLFDAAQWKEYASLRASRLLATATSLYLVVPPGQGQQGLWRAQRSEKPAADLQAAKKVPQAPQQLLSNNIFSAHLEGETLHCIDQEQVLVLEQGAAAPRHIAKPATTTALTADGNGGYWLGLEGQGYVHYLSNGQQLQATAEYIGRFGPRYDSQYYMRYAGGKLLVACGRLDPYEVVQTPQQSMIYEGKQWKLLPTPTAGKNVKGTRFQYATSIAPIPGQTGGYIVTTGRTGVYRYAGEKIAEQWTEGNSPLRSALKVANHPERLNYVRTDGANFDAQGHLFLLNNAQDTCLWALDMFHNRWKGIYIKELEQAPGLERTLIDSRGWLWVTSRRTVSNHDAGFLCLDYAGTIDNTADDVHTYRSSFLNQDGTFCKFQSAMAIAEDLDGSMWLGTDQGLFKVDDPRQWHNENFRITQIKVPRNDGTNYADYLLAGVQITAIAIDPAGRKWVGTSDNGLYLFSPDGQTTLQHFTTSNAPLYSNHIWYVSCHPTTGEVMIATDKGLLTYQSDATQAATMLADGNFKVYPNPVPPGYTGVVRLEGLTFDSDVRVVNGAGITVASGRSQGGSFVWDRRDLAGQLVGSGIYYFYAADEQGSRGAVARVALVR